MTTKQTSRLVIKEFSGLPGKMQDVYCVVVAMVLTEHVLFKLILNLDRHETQLCRVKNGAKGMAVFRLNGSWAIVTAKNRGPSL